MLFTFVKASSGSRESLQLIKKEWNCLQQQAINEEIHWTTHDRKIKKAAPKIELLSLKISELENFTSTIFAYHNQQSLIDSCAINLINIDIHNAVRHQLFENKIRTASVIGKLFFIQLSVDCHSHNCGISVEDSGRSCWVGIVQSTLVLIRCPKSKWTLTQIPLTMLFNCFGGRHFFSIQLNWHKNIMSCRMWNIAQILYMNVSVAGFPPV